MSFPNEPELNHTNIEAYCGYRGGKSFRMYGFEDMVIHKPEFHGLLKSFQVDFKLEDKMSSLISNMIKDRHSVTLEKLDLE